MLALMPRNAGTVDTDSSTLQEESDEPRAGLDESPITAFVIAWYPNDPRRVGELAVLPSAKGEVILGRGAADDAARMRFFRPRPGRLEPTAPLASPGLSRRQLEVRVSGGTISVRRVGKCPLRVNGMECEATEILPGDTLGFRQELLLLCVSRPACPAPVRHGFSALPDEFGEPDRFGLVGESPAAWRLRDELAFAAKSGQHVLLLGESGTGKELAAAALHQLSSRARRPFVARNAATLPSGLIDAEVFGNVRNYPNAGMAERPGLVGQADGGLLFLDEIGELSPELQTHLLRVLDQHGDYQRLGEATVRRSDFRLIGATNRDPAELRRDLLARFPIRIELPPLRERREDIPLILRHLMLRALGRDPDLLGRFTAPANDGRTRVRADTLLIDAALRGRCEANARDLEMWVWKAIAASDGDVVRYTPSLDRIIKYEPTSLNEPVRSVTERVRNREPTLEEIRDALQREGGNITRAAEELGLSSRYALHRILRKLRIEGGQTFD